MLDDQPDPKPKPTNNINLPFQPKKIAILYSHALREYFATEEHYLTEKEVYDRAKIIQQHLIKLGHQCELFPGDTDVITNISHFKPDRVINMVDSVYGKEYLSATIPASLELLQVNYTGTGMLGQAINANKYLTKTILSQYGITTPKYQLIRDDKDDIDEQLDYPLIMKLNEVHGSVEINQDAICHSEKDAQRRLQFLTRTYQQPVLCEEFIVGREITVIVIEAGNTKLYAAEKIFARESDDPFAKIVTFEDNWLETNENEISYLKYELPEKVKEDIKTTFSILKMEDYAKFDYRVDQSGRHYLIDANSNPALGSKDHCAIGSILDLYDISFITFLRRLLNHD